MKRLSKMAYELRDVTIFYQRMVRQEPIDGIAFDHNRSKSRIHQILRKQRVRYGFYVKQITALHEQIFAKSIIKKYLVEQFYHYEIKLILQRYYIRIKMLIPTTIREKWLTKKELKVLYQDEK